MGAKTGFTDEAGICLASYIKNGKEEFILVTLKANYDVNKNQNFLDQKHLMDFYLDKYEVKKIIKKNDVLASVKTSFKYLLKLFLFSFKTCFRDVIMPYYK